MRASSTTLGLALVALLGAALASHRGRRAEAPPARPPDAVPSSEERAGRDLFLRGRLPSGEPLAGFLGEERVPLLGEAAACANCHGPDGEGRSEGGAQAPGLTASQLFRPVPPGSPGTPARPAYDAQRLLRAVTHGRAASGRRLSSVMPRFELAAQDAAALLAYLRQLGERPPPGVLPDRLLLGAALPLSGPDAALGQAIREVLEASLAEVNARGGIFRRRLELLVEDEAASTARGAAPDASARLLDRGVFALVASVRRGASPSDARLREERAALVGPLALSPAEEAPADVPVFYLHPALARQARALVAHLAREQPPPRSGPRAAPLALVYSRDPLGESWAEGARAELARRQLAGAPQHAFSPGDLQPDALRALLHRTGARSVLYAGSGESLAALLRALQGLPALRVYAPVALVGREVEALPPALARRVLLVTPAPLWPGSLPGAGEFPAFLRRHGLALTHPAAQAHAYAAVRLLGEALQRSGRSVTRNALLATLESVRDFDTGVTAPLSFGPARRVGADGARLARVVPGASRLEALPVWMPTPPEAPETWVSLGSPDVE